MTNKSSRTHIVKSPKKPRAKVTNAAKKIQEEGKVKLVFAIFRKKNKCFQKCNPKTIWDPEPITPVAAAFVIKEGEFQQWGQSTGRSSQLGVGSQRKRRSKIMFTNDAENVSVSSDDEPKISGDIVDNADVRTWVFHKV